MLDLTSRDPPLWRVCDNCLRDSGSRIPAENAIFPDRW